MMTGSMAGFQRLEVVWRLNVEQEEVSGGMLDVWHDGEGTVHEEDCYRDLRTVVLLLEDGRSDVWACLMHVLWKRNHGVSVGTTAKAGSPLPLKTGLTW